MILCQKRFILVISCLEKLNFQAVIKLAASAASPTAWELLGNFDFECSGIFGEDRKGPSSMGFEGRPTDGCDGAAFWYDLTP